MKTFTDKVKAIQAETGGNWLLNLSPEVEKLPLDIQRYDDPFLPYLRVIHRAAAGMVCGYVFDLGAYLRMGAAGAVALERSIDLVGETHLTILDSGFGSDRYVTLWEETAFGCDALTLRDASLLAAYSGRADRCAFIVGGDESIPAYDASGRIFRVDGLTLRMLPEDTLFRARSLNFEDTLREVLAQAVADAG
ncbi:MAG: hypothetical protein MUF38_15090 [Anaerolineae bacterium]|jgi:hypothetical protein|nr:hypothetical protein [Anaerolineae bacterium]